MKYLLRIMLALALCGLPGASTLARTLNLYTFHSPPYQESPPSTPGSIQRPFGTTVETVRCVASVMGWEARIRVVPQNRALHGLQNHLIDGYFAVDESDVLNRFAQPTAPVALEKWYFYSLQPIEDFSSARIATIAGSNEAIWLEQSRYDTTITVTYPEQLLAMLERDRVDAVLMDERVMSLQRHKAQYPDDLYSRFVRFAPLSLYVTLPFATNNPTFLHEFNRHIPKCMTGGFELSENELASAATRARTLIDELATMYDLQGHLASLAPPAALNQILDLDRRWRDKAPFRASEKAAEILRSPLSVKLAQWQYEQGGTVTETLVMDKVGANVALSILTSDYWQGDERKFEAIAGKDSETLYLGPVRFDPSTQMFQVIASMPIHDPETGRFIGGVALGLNIEEALRSQYLFPTK